MQAVEPPEVWAASNSPVCYWVRLFTPSRWGMGLGAYGASMSVYTNFFSRGRDIVFAKDTAMDIGIRPRVEPVPKP